MFSAAGHCSLGGNRDKHNRLFVMLLSIVSVCSYKYLIKILVSSAYPVTINVHMPITGSLYVKHQTW